ncbi:ATP-binding protein [Gordonia sp. HNM0687]|uniref:ATP-binding protein n=1 Tax=Gordonia mangrovi TaxID=2665643 RepID=A0A6L7GLU8_9ACTN|nr:ATP-binding protein [Gordonia mangrovi]MXP20493.1 ATP-binding protein [Gordonia mangrovi]UVF78913.1 ATP-binding protein [Gordonia mangrovi]
MSGAARRLWTATRDGFGRGRSRVDDSDSARLERVGTRFVGCGLLAFSVAQTPVAVRSAHLTAAWWTPLSVVLVVGPALALVVMTFYRQPRGLTWLVGACALGYLAATLLWFVAWLGVPDDTDRYSVWLIQFPSVASIALVLVNRTRWAVANLVVATLLVHAANQIGLDGAAQPRELLSAPLTMALSGVFMAVAYATSRNVRALDARREATITAAAATAAAVAREAERARFAAVIHDRVIASLLAVEQGRPDRRLVGQAASALDELDLGDDRESPPVVAPQLVQRVRQLADEVGGEVTVALPAPGPDIGYPAEVCSAICGAVGEALRNWGRHAGAGTRCTVDGDLDQDAISIRVTDDGVGFDPVAVGSERYGVAVGIRGRMDAVAGGLAEVSAAPGAGTRIVVGWRRP